MSQLYTLTILRQKITHHADGRVTENHRLENMTGLPAQLVETWKRDFPAAVVTVAPEAPDTKRKTKRFSRAEVVKAARSQDHRGTSRGSKPHTVSEPDWSIAGLINREIQEMSK